MPRPKGIANVDFAESRTALIAKLRNALLGTEPPSSLRSLAAAADVAVPTLRHYFGDKDGVLAAVFADCHAGGAHEMLVAASPTGSFKESVGDLVQHISDGFSHGRLDRLHAVGLTEGLAAADVAFAYLADVLEPTIEAATTRLQVHLDRGEMRPVVVRHAAVALLAPIIVIYLHQRGLNGSTTHPTDIDALLATHVDGFVTGYAADNGKARKQRQR